MVTLRRADERGRTSIDWLDSRHTFSFGGYHDPAHMAYRSLRVINDDRVAPGQGFGEHGHRDMEILTYVLDGQLQHRDSLTPQKDSVIKPGDVQIMSAGTGIRHSEFNPSDADPVHLLQVWITPERPGLPPRYEQRHFPETERIGRPRLIASREARDGSVRIFQNADVYALIVKDGQMVTHRPGDDRHVWVHVARGEAQLNGRPMGEGDGAAIEGEPIEIIGHRFAEALVFDLG